jgi:hypothetical protein
VKDAQVDKQARHAQLEKLQRDGDKMIEKFQVEKGVIDKMHA